MEDLWHYTNHPEDAISLPPDDWRVQAVTLLERVANALEEIAYDEQGLVRTVSRRQTETPAPHARVPFPLKSISRTASGGCIVRITQPVYEATWAPEIDAEPHLDVVDADREWTHQIPVPRVEGFLFGVLTGEQDAEGFAPLTFTEPLDIAAELAKAERGAS